MCLSGREECGWVVGVEVDGVDACLPAVEEPDMDWFSEDYIDVVRALEGDRCAGLVALDLQLVLRALAAQTDCADLFPGDGGVELEAGAKMKLCVADDVWIRA